MNRSVRTGLALATDPEGRRHVLASATRREGSRAGWQGLSDLGRSGREGTFARLVAPTRLDDDAQLADLLAHLAPLPLPTVDVPQFDGSEDERAAEPANEPIDVIDLTGGTALPEFLAAPGGRDFQLLQGTAPFDLEGRALLLATAHAPGGAWWAPVGETPPEIDAFGALLCRAGLLGPNVRTAGADLFERDVLAPLFGAELEAADLAAVAVSLEARLRGADAGTSVARAPFTASIDRRVASAPVMWTFTTERLDATVAEGPDAAASPEVDAGEADPSEPDPSEKGRADEFSSAEAPSDGERRATFASADWKASAIAELDAARDARLFPYWLLLFEPDAHGRLRFTRAENARRRLAAQDPTPHTETGDVWVLEEDA